MEPVRLGIIGCGVIGKHHIRTASVSPLVHLVALADAIPQRLTEVADQYGVGRRYTEGAELLDDPEMEAVILALPTCGRYELAMQAFANGLHVLTEKPVAMNAAEVERLIIARGDRVAACGHSRNRYSESARQIRAFLASGALGDLRIINCRAIGACSGPPKAPPPTWRLIRAQNGGGILVNWGCYDLAYLLGLTGWQLVPRQVLARTWTVPPPYADFVAPDSDAETHVAALVLFEDGVALNYERSEYSAARSEALWQITGTQGALHLHVTDKNHTVTLDRATSDRGTVSEELFPPVEEPFDGMRGQLDDFARAIREGRRPMEGLQEALVVQRITDAIYASAERGECVAI